MNSLVVIFIAFGISAAYSSAIPLGAILQAPLARTIVAAPHAGLISTVDGVGVLSTAGIIPSAPILARAGPVWGLGGNTVVAGPSGVISTNDGLGVAALNGWW